MMPLFAFSTQPLSSVGVPSDCSKDSPEDRAWLLHSLSVSGRWPTEEQVTTLFAQSFEEPGDADALSDGGGGSSDAAGD